MSRGEHKVHHNVNEHHMTASTSINRENFFVLPMIFLHIAAPHICASPSLSASQTHRDGKKDTAPAPLLRQSQKQTGIDKIRSYCGCRVRGTQMRVTQRPRRSAAVSFLHELSSCSAHWLTSDKEDGLFSCTANMLDRHFHGVYFLSYHRRGCVCLRCSVLARGLVLSSLLITLTRNEFGLDLYMWGREITLAARFTLKPLERRHQHHSSKTMRTETWASEVNSKLQGGIRYLFSKDAVLLEGQTPFSYVSAFKGLTVVPRTGEPFSFWF